MNKSVVILISVIWLLCTLYYTMARMNEGYHYEQYAMIGAWTASALLLISIIIYIRKHRNSKK